MPPRFLEAEQGSDLWKEHRAGHATASRFADILAGKGQREAYLWDLVGERLAGPSRDAGGMAKAWGHESEDLARRAYTIRTGNLVQQVGFAVHSKIRWCGASSDGLVGADGFVEIKSPFNSGIHARTLALGMPGMHDAQLQGNAWILERQWGMFLSYDPAFTAPHDLYMQRIERDDRFIKHLEVEVKKFLAEVAVAVRDIQNSN